MVANTWINTLSCLLPHHDASAVMAAGTASDEKLNVIHQGCMTTHRPWQMKDLMECSVVSNNNLVNQLDILQDKLALFIFFQCQGIGIK